jgi:hypothetical protein
MFGIARLPKLDNENRIPVAFFQEREIRFFLGKVRGGCLFLWIAEKGAGRHFSAAWT